MPDPEPTTSSANGGVPASAPTALMVAFHFPPQSGSSGVLRTLNFVRYLPERGWRLHVLSAHPRAYVERSAALLDAVPPCTSVSRVFALDAARHLAWRGKYLGWMAIPDRWVSWSLAAILRGWWIARRADVKVVWSTYPIATAHLIGAAVSRLSGKPWVADFRDPMHANSHELSGLQARVVAFIERQALSRASACVFTSRRAADQHARLYPDAAPRCHVIENGYDERAFDDLVPERTGLAPDRLLFLHSGLIYPRDRDPGNFFLAVRRLIDSGALQREQVCIRFRAPQHGDEVMARARESGMADLVEVAPAIPYREALAEMIAADLLLVFQGTKFNAQIPAKIYEYLRARGHLLAVVDPLGDTAAVLRSFSGLGIADIASADDIQAAIETWLRARHSQELASVQAQNQKAVARYSREKQTAELAELLNGIARAGAASTAPQPNP